jgi:hypothetical protein
MWSQWVDALRSMVGLAPEGLHVPIPLPLRTAGALALVVWGARTDRRWTVLVAATLAMPSIWLATLAPLAGLVRLGRSTTDPTPELVK